MFKVLIRNLLNHKNSAELIASTIAINLLALGSSIYSIHLLNRYVSIGLTPTLVTLTFGALMAVVFEVILRRLRQKVLDQINTEHDQTVNKRIFDAFTSAKFESLTNIELATKREALGATTQLQQLRSTQNLGSVLDLPFAILFIVLSALLYWPFGVLAFIGCLTAIAMGIRGEKVQRSSNEAYSKFNARAQQLNQFLIASAEAIRCLPLKLPLHRRWTSIQHESLGARRDAMALQSALQTSIQLVGQLLSISVYALGAVAVVKGDLTTGALIGGNILVSRAFAVVSRAAYLADPILRGNRAEESLGNIEKLPIENLIGLEPAILSGRIEMIEASFIYPGMSLPIFERLNLSLNEGQVMVVTGPNGAGKSTLIKNLLGLLVPKTGLIKIDGIELKQLAADWWRSNTGYAPQDPVFFDGTLRENLLLDRIVDDDKLIEWIKILGLESYLASDPAGLERQINSHDIAMSVGIRRRFLLIRAILGGGKIIFLDEPTEGLDQQGQACVAALLNKLLQENKTIVVASNEIFIMRAADVVIDMSVKTTPSVRMQSKLLPKNEAMITESIETPI